MHNIKWMISDNIRKSIIVQFCLFFLLEVNSYETVELIRFHRRNTQVRYNNNDDDDDD
jgi:hypothetical protein